MEKDIKLTQAEEVLESNKAEAEKLLKDVDKTEKFLQELEEKFKKIPHTGEKLSYVPILISMVRSYIRKEYTNITWASIVLTVSALIYVLSPIDIIPDNIPVLGYLDDTIVLIACLTYIDVEVKEYIEWRKANGKEL